MRSARALTGNDMNDPDEATMRILFVSPRHPEADWLFNALQECAHSLCRSTALAEAANEAAADAFDAAVLMVNDAARSVEIGAVLEKVRAAAPRALVFVVLVEASWHEREAILRAGADACFARPLSFVDIHERLQALHHAMRWHAVPATQRAGVALKLDPVTRELVRGEQRLPLTKREYLLLECLMRKPETAFTHDQLLRYAWPEKSHFDFGSVSPLVWRLRCKLKKHLPSVRIQTVNAYGYQLSLNPV
jgi:two-component system, OmpR family, response regulator